jgi:molybdopterin synthase sulfur carrier subunit
MVTVTLSGPLQSRAGGRTTFEVEASNVIGLLRALGETYPDLKPILDAGVVVAIDNAVYRDSWLQPIPDGAEVMLLPKLAGGRGP